VATTAAGAVGSAATQGNRKAREGPPHSPTAMMSATTRLAVAVALSGSAANGRVCVMQYDTRYATYQPSKFWWDTVAINREWARLQGHEYRVLYGDSACMGGSRHLVWCSIMAAIALLEDDPACDVVFKLDSDAYLHPWAPLRRFWSGSHDLAFASNLPWGHGPNAGVWLAKREALPTLCRWLAGQGPFQPPTGLSAPFNPRPYFKHYYALEQAVMAAMEMNRTSIPNPFPGKGFMDCFEDNCTLSHAGRCTPARREDIVRYRERLGIATPSIRAARLDVSLDAFHARCSRPWNVDLVVDDQTRPSGVIGKPRDTEWGCAWPAEGAEENGLLKGFGALVLAMLMCTVAAWIRRCAVPGHTVRHSRQYAHVRKELPSGPAQDSEI
jgi:hypothetical protein